MNVLLGAALIAAIATFASRPVALATGAVATVRADRWHASGQLPRLAGPALWVALVPWVELELLLVLAGFCAVGAVDDYRPLRAFVKAALLLVPCAGAAWVTGEAWVGLACWLSANAVNMLDHADGTAASACAGSLLVAGGPLGIAGAGASLGFLTQNWPPARVFLGDGGSLMLGALLVLAWSSAPVAWLAGSAVPLLDAAFVVARRIRRGRPPWVGGTDHSGHELLRHGMHAAWLPVLYGSTAALCAFVSGAWR
jgi:UDP-GlcNAc:undecaprenyl-phosphate/decaprenyl-phosphate GlcNAc-1-phosphate transferase